MQLNLSINEINLIMQALGNEPYVQVFELVQKIREQAQAQMTAPTEEKVNG